MSDFEAHNPPNLFSSSSSSSISSIAVEIPNPYKVGSSNFSYQGISLPKALKEFLMIVEMSHNKREEKKIIKKRGSHSFSEMEQVKELGKAMFRFLKCMSP